mgnify:CR=1 FL=1
MFCSFFILKWKEEEKKKKKETKRNYVDELGFTEPWAASIEHPLFL